MPRQISQSAGTNIGNMIEQGGLAAAFDGVTDQAQTASAYRTAAEGTVGKDYGSGVTKEVIRWVAYGANGGIGFNNWPSNGAVMLYCEYSSDGSSWTTADSVNWNTSGAGPVDRTFTSVGAYRYWRLRINDGAVDARCAELQFWEPDLALVANAGSFTFTGIATAASYASAPAAGTFVLSGQVAGLLYSTLLSAAAGSYSLTGQTVDFARGQIIVPDAGAFTLTGQDTLVQRVMSAAVGVHTLMGQNVELVFNSYITAEHAVFTLTGGDVNMSFGIMVIAETGVFVLNSPSVALTISMAANPAEFLHTGQDVNMFVSAFGAWLSEASLADIWVSEDSV